MAHVIHGVAGGLLAITAGGCGFHATIAASTDAFDAPSDVDIDAPAIPCLDRWLAGTIRFAPPMRLDTLSVTTFADRDPYVTADGLKIYFTTTRNDAVTFTGDIFVAKRLGVTDSFSNPGQFADATTLFDDGKLSMTDDELRLVVSNDSLNDADLFEATRTTATGMFGPLGTSHFGSTIDNGNDQEDPWISNDGLRIYYALDTGVQHIALTTRTATDQNFQTPMIVATLDSNVGDADPALNADERIILFSSNRTLSGFGGSNMWYATRDSAAGTFGAPQPIPDLNTGSNEGDAVFAADGCALYFSSDRMGDYDLFVATAM